MIITLKKCYKQKQMSLTKKKKSQNQPTFTSNPSWFQFTKFAANTEMNNTKIALNKIILLVLACGSSSSTSSKLGSESVIDDSGSGSSKTCISSACIRQAIKS